MSRATLSSLFVVVVALAGPEPFAPSSEAQEERGDVSQVFFVQPKAGEVLQWEQAYKKHLDWHRSNHDMWSWPVWEITTGERTGQFAVGTFFHNWQDLERGEFGAKDRDHALKNQGRHTESNTVEIWRYRPGVSNPPAYEGVPAYAIVYYRHLNQGMMGVYTEAVRKINHAITVANWDTGDYRNILVNSGEEPTAVRWVARPTWQAFAPPEKSFPKLLEEAYGKEEADAVQDALNRSIHCGRSEVWTYRPDLSHTPGGQ